MILPGEGAATSPAPVNIKQKVPTYCLFGKGSAKSSAPGAVIIHFFGGIHEIYFPYILMEISNDTAW
jgi:hypothetical protein